MGQPADEIRAVSDDDEVSQHEGEIEHTRSEMSETIEAIQQRLVPERLADETKDVAADVTDHAKHAAIETVDHAVHEAKVALQDWSELARVAALETIDHALAEAQATLPAVSEHAKTIAQESVDHAIDAAKAAVRELGEQARVAVRDATIGKVERMAQTTEATSKRMATRVVTVVKQNPGQVALTGLGLGWLILNSRQATAAGAPPATDASKASDHHQTASGRAQEQVADGLKQAGTQAHEAAVHAQDVAGDVAGQVKETALTVTDQVQETAGKVAERTHSAIGQFTEQVQLLPERVREQLEEKPLAVGIVAVAIGGAAALVIPATQREQQLLGPARDTLVDRAQMSAQEIVQKVQRVTEEAGEAVGKEARVQGLTPQP